MSVTVNFWAVLLSAIVSMVIGSIWYGPLFGKMFMSAMGMNIWTPEKQEAMKKRMSFTYVGQFVASLVMFYIFARINGGLQQMTLVGGVTTAFWVWLGFVVPLKLGEVLWGGRLTLFWLSIFNILLTLLATGAIVGVWK